MPIRVYQILILMLCLASGCTRSVETRAPQREAAPKPALGLFVAKGAWAIEVKALTKVLEDDGLRVQLLQAKDLVPARLRELDALLVPGGWAPDQRASAGPQGIDAMREYVRGGGRYVGICAGAYLASREVRWEGVDYPYPLAVFSGRATGPLPGLPPWPQSSNVQMTVTRAGQAIGLRSAAVFYMGGSCFEESAGTTALARYPDGSIAMLRSAFGEGEVLLSGLHFALRKAPDGSVVARPGAAPILRRLLFSKLTK